MIQNIQDIQKLLLQGFTDWKELGQVNVRERGDLRIFNYANAAQYEARWNPFEVMSRGLILHSKTGEIVARSFDKFFNWGENNRFPQGGIRTAMEKMDGCLGVLYREEGLYRISTRGSMESPQAHWATEFLQNNYDLKGRMPEEWTLIFEVIHPSYRIVVDYQGRKDLVLLAIRNRFTGDFLPWESVQKVAETLGFGLPQVYQFGTPEEILEVLPTLHANSEGWVVEFDCGSRFKFKGQEYKNLHRLICGLSFKNTLECMANGNLDELRSLIPDEFMGEVDAWVKEIQEVVQDTEQRVEEAYALAPKESRKEFALWVMKEHPDLKGYLFGKLDGKPILPMIYKSGFDQQLKFHAQDAIEEHSE